MKFRIRPIDSFTFIKIIQRTDLVAGCFETTVRIDPIVFLWL